jgi:coenzyme PQQ precursor peptide PqqA
LTPSAFGSTLDAERVGRRKKRGALTVALELRRTHMQERNRQEWHRPEVVEEQVGLEVTSYLPAELDRD